ncbi:MAG TPA: hypothetical protein VMS17_18870 [Gemmataceae bacterium]|nr:hypothetical protein [Gemmataceae bacterium]
MRRIAPYALLILPLAVPTADGQTAPPLVDALEWAPLRDHCRNLLDGLDALKAPLPAETTRALQALLKQPPADPDAAAAAVQKLLDPCCLLVVSINPESRVKAARGPAESELTLDQERIVLVKVQNDAGSTARLGVSGPGIRAAGETGDGRWLEAAPATDSPLSRTLSGRRLEYVVLRLTAREAGKREATFRFDVGQGTQDLGFRAETPILFTVQGR